MWPLSSFLVGKTFFAIYIGYEALAFQVSAACLCAYLVSTGHSFRIRLRHVWIFGGAMAHGYIGPALALLTAAAITWDEPSHRTLPYVLFVILMGLSEGTFARSRIGPLTSFRRHRRTRVAVAHDLPDMPT